MRINKNIFYVAVGIIVFGCLAWYVLDRLNNSAHRGFGSNALHSVATIQFPKIGPYNADFDGMPQGNWKFPIYQLPTEIVPGAKYTIRGAFEVEPGGSAPQLLKISFCSLRYLGDKNENVVIVTKNPNPVFEGSFGSEIAKFDTDFYVPKLSASRLSSKYFVLILSAPIFGNDGPGETVVIGKAYGKLCDANSDPMDVMAVIDR